jgi:hypothetical protein
VAKLVAKGSVDGAKTSGYDATKYIGTFVSTAESLTKIDALRCFESQVRIGIDREGKLYLRRSGVVCTHARTRPPQRLQLPSALMDSDLTLAGKSICARLGWFLTESVAAGWGVGLWRRARGKRSLL